MATNELIAKRVEDISAKIDAILNPFLDKLEGDLSNYEQEWIQKGFFADKKGFIGSDLGFVMNLKFIAAYFGKNKAGECLSNYLLTMIPEEKTVFIDTLTGKVEYKPLKSSLFGKYSEARELGLNSKVFRLN